MCHLTDDQVRKLLRDKTAVIEDLEVRVRLLEGKVCELEDVIAAHVACSAQLTPELRSDGAAA